MQNKNKWAIGFLYWLKFPFSSNNLFEHLLRVKDISVDCWPQFDGWSLLQREFFKSHPQWQESFYRLFEKVIEKNFSITLRGEEDYPPSFSHLRYPPSVLTWIGSAHWQREGHLAIVGSREVSCDSKKWLELHLPKVLQAFPLLTISGGARGVDQLVHAISIRQEQRTCCVLPSGLCRIYPTDLQSWIAPIIEMGGSIISPFSLFQEMKKYHFYFRNQLIASLAGLILAVDARRKSGTMITARAAIELGRAVAVLPQHPMRHQALGCLDLIYDGAVPLRDHLDLESLCHIYVRREIFFSSSSRRSMERP